MIRTNRPKLKCLKHIGFGNCTTAPKQHLPKETNAMQIDNTNADTVSGFYSVEFETFAQTLTESKITDTYEMGGGVTIHHGTRDGAPIWLMENPCGKLNGIWVEDDARH